MDGKRFINFSKSSYHNYLFLPDKMIEYYFFPVISSSPRINNNKRVATKCVPFPDTEPRMSSWALIIIMIMTHHYLMIFR